MQQLRETSDASLAGQCAREVLAGIPGVMRFIRGQMRANRAGLTVPQFRTLVFLSLNDRPSLSELADHLGLSLPAASRMVDLLVRRTLIQRSPQPHDRRRVCLGLTAMGRQKFQAAHEATRQALADNLSRLSRSELTRLREGMRVLCRVFAAEQGKTAAPAPPNVKSRRRRSGVLP
ncbi:MAG TPA: MarR family transcriptional regulator [Phycisphaerae bacterium]|nr:MarR family transcriptional regulator [Phycisphaerae bacterium]HOJ73387.1 MarR family transcriptional regulator [Phycisphaerae bacterium]HOM50996.1 MarR family transcriptional regulator [Phycisphaerae bacterium]HON68103.1 MarR family transcriptional regulator [Phycisphaerae bacterium]HOQ86722.1 MarR family transcriptional regulator [Phycisphaerae bacterium]